MDFLEIIDGNGRRRQVRLDRPRLLIGRDSSCDICLPNPNVSRRHAQLQRTPQDSWILQDLNSLNHIYLNDEEVKQVLLEPGKTVRIGDYLVGLKEPSPTAESESISLSSEDSSPSWPGLEPGWLEQLQQFQRLLLTLDHSRLVLERLAEEFHRITRPQAVAIGLTRPDGYRWEIVNGTAELHDPEHLKEASVYAGSDDSDVKTWNQGHVPGETAALAAAYCVLFPMKGRAGTLGHIYLRKPRQIPPPTAQLRYLSLYATSAALMYENLQVNALRVAQREMEQELRAARQIQSELFPPSFDLDPRLNCSGVNLPSVHISGDYYDVIKTGKDTVVFVVADAMGHGISAALTVAVFSATLRMGTKLGLAWDDLFRGLDTSIGHGHSTRFVTGLIGQINLATKTLELLIAGHDPPSILVKGRTVRVPDGCKTRPWGLDLPASWEVSRISLGDGEWSILAYTDGIKEARINGQAFGVSGVTKYHTDFCHSSAEDVCQGLVGLVARQSESTTLADDQTVLVLRSGGSRSRQDGTRETPAYRE